MRVFTRLVAVLAVLFMVSTSILVAVSHSYSKHVSKTLKGSTMYTHYFIAETDYGGYIVAPGSLSAEYMDTVLFDKKYPPGCSVSSPKNINVKWKTSPPRGYVYVDGVYYYLDYSVEVNSSSVSKFDEEHNETIVEFGAQARIVIRADIIYIDNPPSAIDLGEVIRKATGGEDPVLEIYFTESVTCGSKKDYYYVKLDYKLSTKNLVVQVTTFTMSVKEPELSGYTSTGSLLNEVVVMPVYTIEVCAKAVGAQPYPFKAEVLVPQAEVYSGDLNFSEPSGIITIGGEEDCVDIRFPFQPNETSSLVVLLRSAFFTIKYSKNVSLTGLSLNAGPVYAYYYKDGDDYVFKLAVPYAGRAVEVSGLLDLNASLPSGYSFYCGPAIIQPGNFTSGVLFCSRRVPGYAFQPASNGSTALDVCLRIGDGLYFYTVCGDVVAGHTSMSSYTLLGNLYAFSTNTMLMAGFILLIIGYVLELLDLFISTGLGGSFIYIGITLLLASMVVKALVPIAVYTTGELLHAYPAFSKYIAPPPSRNPDSLFRWGISYYDKLFNAINSDYYTYFIAQLHKITATAGQTVSLVLALFAVAAAIGFLKGLGGQVANILITVGGVALSIVTGYLGLMMTLMPASAFIIVGLSLVKVFIDIAVALSILLFIVGVAFVLSPGHSLRVLGEEMVGAAITFMVIMPVLGPISYGMYKHIADTVFPKLSTTNYYTQIDLWKIHLGYPTKEIVLITAFMTLSGVVLGLVVLGLAAVLQRSGIFAGLGEAFTGLITPRI